MSQKLERIRAYAESHPTDPFAWYGVAMELRGLGRLEEAIEAFDKLVREFPAYVPTYLMFGFTLQAAGRSARAREIFEQGLAAAQKAGNNHAAGELQGALDTLED